MRFSIIKQNRFRILICEGYRYSRYMVVYNKEYWRCTDRTCKGKLHLSGGRIVYVKRNGHNHGPDHKGISAEQALFIMRKRAYNEDTPFQQIYQDTVQEMEDAGHGPMKELLPYADCRWQVLNQGQEINDDAAVQKTSNGARCSAHTGKEAVSVNRDHYTELHVESNSRDAGDKMPRGIVTDGPKPEICELEVVDCTDQTAESFSVTIATDSFNTMLPASHLSTQARNGRAPPSHSPVQSESHRPGATSATSGGVQHGSSTPGLKIHSAYSLQTVTVPTSSSSSMDKPDELPVVEDNPVAYIDVNQHATDNVFEALSQGGRQSTVSRTKTAYANTVLSSGRAVQVGSDVPVFVSQRTKPNPHAALSNQGNRFSRQGGGNFRNTQSRATTACMDRLSGLPDQSGLTPTFSDLTAHPPGQGDPQGQSYVQLQMRLVKKEHRLRLQYMKERHDADMTLVHLQQELVREQLREMHQPRGGLSS
ncbi:uncharacterized protein LOC119723805 isoform X2 [Patiria miniata]|nr:uncharacterized protein LOC119723805 isoform X2 [Patiria miniata]XP_038050604.1 uncharacterized protein LOC119723805 isoform X2 [Patiria miniata]